jgi:hypothetical protein
VRGRIAYAPRAAHFERPEGCAVEHDRAERVEQDQDGDGDELRRPREHCAPPRRRRRRRRTAHRADPPTGEKSNEGEQRAFRHRPRSQRRMHWLRARSVLRAWRTSSVASAPRKARATSYLQSCIPAMMARATTSTAPRSARRNDATPPRGTSTATGSAPRATALRRPGKTSSATATRSADPRPPSTTPLDPDALRPEAHPRAGRRRRRLLEQPHGHELRHDDGHGDALRHRHADRLDPRRAEGYEGARLAFGGGPPPPRRAPPALDPRAPRRSAPRPFAPRRTLAPAG